MFLLSNTTNELISPFGKIIIDQEIVADLRFAYNSIVWCAKAIMQIN